VRVFYDTEFVDDGRTIDLISIGMVAEDGRWLYRVVRDNWTMQRAARHSWLRGNVLPHLPVKVFDRELGLMTAEDRHGQSHEFGNTWEWDEEHPEYSAVRARDDVRIDVTRFLIGTPDVQLWAWFAAYDHVAYAQLFGSMIDLPSSFPMWTGDLKQEAVRLGNPSTPAHTGRVHHALDDALHDMEIARFLDELEGKVHRVQADPWRG
jgi:hypothetical protein